MTSKNAPPSPMPDTFQGPYPNSHNVPSHPDPVPEPGPEEK